MRYHLKDKEPDTLKKAQELAIKIDLNMQSSGKSNIPRFMRALIKSHVSKDKEPSQNAHEKKIMDLTEKMETVEANYVDQLKIIQNRMLNMERAQPNQKKFSPKGSWVQKKTYQQDKRPPNQLESANMVEEVMPYCRLCDALHEDSACYIARQILELGMPETSQISSFSSKPEFVNNVGHVHPITKDA